MSSMRLPTNYLLPNRAKQECRLSYLRDASVMMNLSLFLALKADAVMRRSSSKCPRRTSAMTLATSS